MRIHDAHTVLSVAMLLTMSLGCARAQPKPALKLSSTAPITNPEIIKRMALRGTLAEQTIYTSPQSKLVLFYRHDLESHQFNFWLIYARGQTSTLVEQGQHKLCEHNSAALELTSLPNRDIYMLTISCEDGQDGQDDWRATDIVSLHWDSPQTPTPKPLWRQSLTHSLVRGLCQHTAGLSMTQRQDMLRVEIIPKATWLGPLPIDLESPTFNSITCKRNLPPKRTYEIQLQDMP